MQQAAAFAAWEPLARRRDSSPSALSNTTGHVENSRRPVYVADQASPFGEMIYRQLMTSVTDPAARVTSCRPALNELYPVSRTVPY